MTGCLIVGPRRSEFYKLWRERGDCKMLNLKPSLSFTNHFNYWSYSNTIFVLGGIIEV